MADKGLGQGSLKYWRETKCLIKCDRINLEIFRKKKVHKMAAFQIQLQNFSFDEALKNQATLILEASIKERTVTQAYPVWKDTW